MDMHELDLVRTIVDVASEAARAAGATTVAAVQVKVGRLAGVEAGALVASFGVACSGTVLEGSRFEIIDVPIAVWCAHCLKEVELPRVNHFFCPDCGVAAGEVRRGRELEGAALEIES